MDGNCFAFVQDDPWSQSETDHSTHIPCEQWLSVGTMLWSGGILDTLGTFLLSSYVGAILAFREWATGASCPLKHWTLFTQWKVVSTSI